MNYLVTGGAGFIGSNFIDYMLAQHPHCRIVCLDKLTYAADMSNLANALPSPRFTFVKGDICAERALGKLFEREKFDAVINFAAETHVAQDCAGNLYYKREVLSYKHILRHPVEAKQMLPQLLNLLVGISKVDSKDIRACLVSMM